MNRQALVKLWNTTQLHRGTGGARVCTGVLLGLYNGTRFPFDLVELRCLDGALLSAAIEVIHCDAAHCEMEVHEHLNAITGRRDFGQRFEHMAWEWNLPTFKRGRCKKEHLMGLSPERLVIESAPATQEVSA